VVSDIAEPRAAAPRLDELPIADVVARLLGGEARVLPALRAAAPQLARAAAVLTGVITGGGRLVFTGAGTSGRLAAAEAAELPGTFGIAATRCLGVIAGADGPAIDDAAEDDVEAGRAGVRAARLRAGDVVVAVAATGRGGGGAGRGRERHRGREHRRLAAGRTRDRRGRGSRRR
jgi:N-acetylmuramic acid 6-phosphate etherase